MEDGLSSWLEMLTEELNKHGEMVADIESCTLDEEGLRLRFDDGYGSARGVPFTAWTSNRVYFPAVYDGAEWVASVSRNPDDKPTNHVGGG